MEQDGGDDGRIGQKCEEEAALRRREGGDGVEGACSRSSAKGGRAQ